MPGNRRVKYLRKCDLKYIYVGGALCLAMGGLNIEVSVL
jgi:hypothetical protein